MNWFLIGLAVVLYFGCCVASYGAAFAYFQGKYSATADDEWPSDKKFALAVSWAGPISLIITYMRSERFKYGWRWPK